MKQETTTKKKPTKKPAKEAKEKTMPTFGMFKYMQTKNNK